MTRERAIVSKPRTGWRAWLGVAAIALWAAGCGDGASKTEPTVDAAAGGTGGTGGGAKGGSGGTSSGGAGGSAGGGGGPDAAMDVIPSDAAAPDAKAPLPDAAAPDMTPPGPPPVYAIASTVFMPDTETTYVSVLDTLDVKQIDYKLAREYPGRGAIAAYGGWLFVSDGESPTVTRNAIAADVTLKEDGKISFANFGLETAAVDEWSTTFVSPTKAYLLSWESGSHIVWNPTKMEIAGEIKAPELIKKDLSLDGSTAVVRANRLYRTFFWKDWDAYTTSKEQFLATFDVETDKLLSLTPEMRCPGLNNRVDTDEAGNLYFSNWIYNVTETLVRGAPRSCALRIAAGATGFDPGWVLPFADLTEKREAAGLSYLKGGKAFLAVFHNERVTIDAMTDPQKLALSANWRLWGVDLAQKTAKPLEGIDWLIGGYSTVRLDGRTFVLVPGADLAKTSVYEITEDGKVTLRFETKGFAYQFVKVR